jgi:hypothetical protein
MYDIHDPDKQGDSHVNPKEDLNGGKYTGLLPKL